MLIVTGGQPTRSSLPCLPWCTPPATLTSTQQDEGGINLLLDRSHPGHNRLSLIVAHAMITNLCGICARGWEDRREVSVGKGGLRNR